MKKLRANVCAVTHAGRIRRENEDNYSLNGRLTSTGDLKKGSAFVQGIFLEYGITVDDEKQTLKELQQEVNMLKNQGLRGTILEVF